MPDCEPMPNAPVVEVERRREERVPYHDLKIWYDGCTEAVKVRSPNLTPHGMFINTPRIFAEGTELRVRFDLLRSGVIVHARAEVRYCLPGIGVGVRFIALPEYARLAIEKELEEIKQSAAKGQN